MPTAEPRLTIRAVRPLVSGLQALGHDAAALLAVVGIDEAALRDPDARVPMSALVRLVASAVERTGDPNLGLHLAEQADPGSTDVHFYAMLSSPTLGAAYQRLVHDTSRVGLVVGADRAILRHLLAGGGAAPRHSAEFLLAMWLRVGRIVTGVPWTPREVCFVHPDPGGSHEHRRVFGAPVRLRAEETALVLDPTVLAMPCVRSDPGLLAVLDRYARERLDRAPRTDSVADRVRVALAKALRQGEAGAGPLAAPLKMSVRTLHRQLAREGTTYRGLLEQVRRDVAAQHLGEDRLSIAEVAFLVGFTELSAFYRAVRRWTGQTPAALRTTLRAGRSPAPPTG